MARSFGVVLAAVLLTRVAQAQEAPGGGDTPGAGALGLRVGFGGNPSLIYPVAITAPTVGVKYFISDDLAFNGDVGFAVNNNGFGVGAGAGLDYYLITGNMRPFLTGTVGFGKDVGAGYNLGFQVGAGLEYFFNRHFSVNARVLIPFVLSNIDTDVVFSMMLFTPGAGLTLYY